MSRAGLPTISVIIPTFNSERTLETCLKSIVNQDYPRRNLEIVVADGGSTDRTLEIAEEYADKVVMNPLRTGEAGKAVGARNAAGDLLAFIDSDNVLPRRDWFRRMVEPFEDPEIVGAEPLYYEYRREDGYITRYSALLGMNDPLCLFLGNYDRYSTLTGRWTELNVREEDRGGYIKIELSEREIPTIGANGFLVRREAVEECSIGDYLFDVDLVYELVRRGYDKFAKVKIGIVHIFCEDVRMFVRKQRRRIRDYMYYKRRGLRKYPWSTVNKSGLLKFVGYTVLVLPLLFQVAKGYKKRPDVAWFFHIPACWMTLVIYACGTVLGP